MSKDKPNFRRNSNETSTKEDKPKKQHRKEIAVVWEKETTTGEKYLNIKFTLPDGREMWAKAFKNKFKKPEETHKPEYVAFENKDPTNAT